MTLMPCVGWLPSCNHSLNENPSPAPTSPSVDYARTVRDLSADSSSETNRIAWDTLMAAGAEAFPALLNHLKDTRAAGPAFQQQREEKTTVGDACFDLLQQQIEGRWPKSVRQFQVLSPENRRQWLDAHRGLDLHELRLAASRESIQKVGAALAKDPSNEFLQHAAKYLKGRNDNAE
jgi:hypothetical protein